jgi:hypothetical protein
MDAIEVANGRGEVWLSLCGVGWGVAAAIARDSERFRGLGRARYAVLKLLHGALAGLGLRKYKAAIAFAADDRYAFSSANEEPILEGKRDAAMIPAAPGAAMQFDISSPDSLGVPLVAAKHSLSPPTVLFADAATDSTRQNADAYAFPLISTAAPSPPRVALPQEGACSGDPSVSVSIVSTATSGPSPSPAPSEGAAALPVAPPMVSNMKNAGGLTLLARENGGSSRAIRPFVDSVRLVRDEHGNMRQAFMPKEQDMDHGEDSSASGKVLKPTGINASDTGAGPSVYFTSDLNNRSVVSLIHPTKQFDILKECTGADCSSCAAFDALHKQASAEKLWTEPRSAEAVTVSLNDAGATAAQALIHRINHTLVDINQPCNNMTQGPVVPGGSYADMRKGADGAGGDVHHSIASSPIKPGGTWLVESPTKAALLDHSSLIEGRVAASFNMHLYTVTNSAPWSLDDTGEYIAVGFINTSPDGRFSHSSDGALDVVLGKKGNAFSTIGLLSRYVGRSIGFKGVDERNSSLFRYFKAMSAVLTPATKTARANKKHAKKERPEHAVLGCNVDGEYMAGPGPFHLRVFPSLITVYKGA